MAKAPRFTRRHHEALATIVRIAKQRPNDCAAEILFDIEQDIADMLARDDARFDRTRFENACAHRAAPTPERVQ
jgi:hypothetical protein